MQSQHCHACVPGDAGICIPVHESAVISKKQNGGQSPPFFHPWVELPSDKRLERVVTEAGEEHVVRSSRSVALSIGEQLTREMRNLRTDLHATELALVELPPET